MGQGTCYAVGGKAVVLPDYGPCDPNNATTFCCTPGQVCLTNGLCATDLATFYSGGCTDSTYKSSICPSFCQGSDHFIVECPGSSSGVKAGDFCCSKDGSQSCCSQSTNGLGLSPSSSLTRAATAGASGAGSSSSTSSPSPGTSAGTSAGASSSASQSSAVSGSNTGTSGLSSSAGSSPATSTAQIHNGLTTGQTIGIVTGSSVAGLLALILLAYFLYRSSHARKESSRVVSKRRASDSKGNALKPEPSVMEADGIQLYELVRQDAELSSDTIDFAFRHARTYTSQTSGPDAGEGPSSAMPQRTSLDERYVRQQLLHPPVSRHQCVEPVELPTDLDGAAEYAASAEQSETEGLASTTATANGRAHSNGSLEVKRLRKGSVNGMGILKRKRPLPRA